MPRSANKYIDDTDKECRDHQPGTHHHRLWDGVSKWNKAFCKAAWLKKTSIRKHEDNSLHNTQNDKKDEQK